MPPSEPIRATRSTEVEGPAAASSFQRKYGQGRGKLLEAAARLVAREGSARLTLRDLASEAGMSQNAIYRHFRNVDEMFASLIEDFSLRLRDGLQQARSRVPLNEPLSRTVVGWLLDFALSNKDVFVVAVRERYGPVGPARRAIEQITHDIMADMRRDLGAAGRLPPLPDDKLDLALRVIVQQTFELCLACIEMPERREKLLAEAELIFAWCMTGAATVSGHPGAA